MKTQTILLEDGSEVIFEIEETTSGPQRVGVGAIKGAKMKFKEAIANIAPLTDELLEALRSSTREPESVEIQMGIKVSGEIGAVVAKATTEGNFLVKVKWTNATAE